MVLKELALFLAGAFACDVVMHIYMWASKTELKIFGVKFTKKVNGILAVVNTIITILLLQYAFAI